MSADVHAIEEMLSDWAQRIRASLGGMLVQLQENWTEEGAARGALIARVRDWHEYLTRLEAQILALRSERLGDPMELFAGEWPPSDPLALLAMRTTLIEDNDELHAIGGYLDADENIAEGVGAVGAAWQEINTAIHNLRPVTREAATAIYTAWKADEDIGFGHEWEATQVKAAASMLGVEWRP
ncbi:MAG: hypothetical protein KGN34_02720 [Sphingomonadales bacterium]|nr:hypothetical protein [Sphingomonadales bacterium]